MMIATKGGLKIKDFGKFNSQTPGVPFTFKGQVEVSNGNWEHAEWGQDGNSITHNGEDFFIGQTKHIPTTKEEVFRFSHDEKLERAFFFIEADSFSKLELWRENNCEKENRFRVEWIEDSSGFSQQIGSLFRKNGKKYEELPVMISLSFALLNDLYVCFYTSDSMVTDWDMVDKFVSKYAGQYDQASRRAMTNAMNFSHCIHYCKNPY